jgi:radical SAM superfamily enzyme YgiQ (UPF0313 family)
MNICLITAPTAAEFNQVEVGGETAQWAASQPQLGILSLAAVLVARGQSPEVVDLNVIYLDQIKFANSANREDYSTSAALLLASRDVRIYGFSTICSSYPLTIRIATALKAIRPDCTVLFGGPQASVVDLQTLSSFSCVDLILRGEAEQTLPGLLDELNGSGQLDDVPGLTYRRDGRPQRNCNAPLIRDLDELPSPAYHLTGQLECAQSASLEIGRGCPFSCTFCSTNDFFRRNFRLRSPERILRDMRALESNYGIRDFELVHDMFTVDRRRVVAFCEAVIASGEGYTWSCSARTDCIDEPLIKLMARAGCNGIFYGIETGSQRLQQIIDKGLDPHRAEEIMDVTERYGIHSTVSLITGFPEETRDDLRDSIRIFLHSSRLPKSSPQLNLLAPLAETPLHSRYKDVLVLDELCSDVSHQGVNLDGFDLELIRKYPEIFPNFYLIPTPHLDRSYLLELREFSLNMDWRFRWLCVALDRTYRDFLGLFEQWREQRLVLRPGLTGFALREYYRREEFRCEFVSFLRAHPAGGHPMVQAFLEYEDAIKERRSRKPPITPAGERVESSAAMRPSDIPVRKERADVITLSCDMQKVIDALKIGGTPRWETGPHYYVTKEVSAGTDQLVGISDWVSAVLRLCDGSRNVAEVMAALTGEIREVEELYVDYIWPKLIEGVREMEVLDIYRVASLAAGSQAEAASMSEYSEMSAAESAQNQPSAHLQ